MTNHLQAVTTLNNGAKMPWLGLGVFKVEEGSELVEAVKTAIIEGYRSIDTAAIYGNEAGVGQGIKEGIKAAGIRREDLFVTSKVWNDHLDYEGTLQAFETSLEKLGLDYLDLYLIHWPGNSKYKQVWSALETLYKKDRIRSIGVSNFQIHHLEELIKDAIIKPVINQVERHPKLTQKELLAFCQQHDIQLEAWSPLMQGQILDHPVLLEIAAKYNKSTAQVILRWDLQQQIVVIPKSTKAHRIKANADLFDFELTKEDTEQIDNLNENHRVGPDPDTFDF
ncbi:aldo/keto reductase [Sediminibacillus halophilus]|uniref:Aldo/keto reductase n=1 Tax=Sediminibacillus halophilus TaxID=482461 RepID=A0A1G9TCZ1_9BACI|nr:aldo/keto reductase [Sediminibacillus halophilus]SDM45484.1 Aldo/keto reductase [Sediminibacillus halophilus]